MGYEISITRQNGHQISKLEWVNLIESDSELIFKEDSKIFAFWKYKPTLRKEIWWEDGAIYSKTPDDYTLIKMLKFAEELNAKVIGEDETEYSLTIKGNVFEIEENGNVITRWENPS